MQINYKINAAKSAFLAGTRGPRLPALRPGWRETGTRLQMICYYK